jgi:tellurite methyltransferase
VYAVARQHLQSYQHYFSIMSKEDLDKWNQRYAEDSYRKNNPVVLLQDWLPKLPVGKALDVACGAGRNSMFLAQAGFNVDAIDISPAGLHKARQQAQSQGLNINWIEHDLDQAFQFDTDYDLIIVMWYVNLALITRLCDCLAAGGYLLCEEHLITDQDVIGPNSTNYRVAPGSLREAVSGLDIMLCEETIENGSDDERVASARVVGRKR